MFTRLATLVLAALVLAPAAGAATMTRSETALLQQMNRVRAAHHLGALRYDTRLEQAARFHSQEMLANDTFEHGAFANRMAQFSIQGNVAGENLAWGVGFRSTPRGVVAAWLASPAHRANLLSPRYRRIGIGRLVGAFSGYDGAAVVTADFAG